MPAAKRPNLTSGPSLRLAGFGLLAAALLGAAALHFAPKSPSRPELLPQMAALAVVMPDGQQFFAQRFEVSVAEWNICAAEGHCAVSLRVRPDQKPETTPATGLSYEDVQQYINWLNTQTRQRFRLPTATEWEHMAADVLPEEPDPLFTDPSLTWASTYLTEGTTPRALKPQGSFSTSPEGVADLDGSVWEWTMACYAGAEEGIDRDRCPAYFVGGEHVAAMSYLIRDPARGGCAVGSPPAHLGPRLISDHEVPRS